MKKFYLILAAALSIGIAAHAEFTSPGNGTTYTMADLAQIEECGVTSVDGAWVLNEPFTISDGDVLLIQNNEVIKFTDKLQINVKGTLDCQPADTALITTVPDASKAKGFRMYADNAKAFLKNTRFEYVGITMGAANGFIKADNCTFDLYNGSNASGACINYSATSVGKNEFINCTLSNGVTAAFGSGANTPVGIKIESCNILCNNTENSNRPQINMTCCGTEDVIILNNNIVGGHFTKSGGIGVNNMLSASFSNKVTIKGNIVRENRYGITMTGPLDVIMEDNQIIDNTYETDPNNGGSAISLYDPTGKGKVYIKGNYMDTNLWGITVIGNPQVNAGKVADKNAEDYNPGLNVFKNNGNGGVLYDLYNNGTGTVYAQGNTWNVDEQTAEMIEEVIFHKHDNAQLGEVIYMPAATPVGINDINVDNVAQARKYIQDGQLIIEKNGIRYNIAGQVVK